MPSEIRLLKERTIKILNAFRALYPKSDMFKDVDIEAINKIDDNATSGFHELYLKCLVFQQLTKNLNETTFLAQTDKGRLLVELLFNPAIEDEMLLDSGLEDLEDLLYQLNDIDINDTAISLFWNHEDARRFADLTTAINLYLTWYQTNKNFLCKNNTDVIHADPDEDVISEIRSTVDDVEQEEYRRGKLRNGEYLGTTGLAVCLAIIGIKKTDSAPIVDVMHTSSDYYDDVYEMINDRFNVDRDHVGIYLIGAHPLDLDTLLPIIYNDEFNIVDVRLARSIHTETSGCVVTSDGKNATVYYSGNLEHTPAVEQKVSNVTNKNWLNSPIHSPSKKRKLTDEIASETRENSPKRVRFDS